MREGVGRALIAAPAKDALVREGVRHVEGRAVNAHQTPRPVKGSRSTRRGHWSSDFAGRVSTAGDVNGDGYADVLVSDDLYTNGESNEGRVSLYLGSPAGIATTPAWTCFTYRR